MSENTTTTADRTPQDFAIEFAEYMAKGAEALITAINADAEVRLRIAESDDVSDDDEEDAQATVSEMQRALQSDIYEFRKLRDRAASAQPPAPAVALPDIKDMCNGPQQLNLNDRAFWVLGWNECRDAVRDAAQAISAEPAGAGYAELPDAKTLGEAVAAWIGVETRGAHNWVDTTVDRLGFAVRSVMGDMLRASHGQAPAWVKAERSDALCDSSYIAGAKAGFNLGAENNYDALTLLVDGRHGYLQVLAATRTQDTPTPQAAQQAPAADNWIAAEEVQRLVRELDVALNGKEGAAAQASLCDVVAQVVRTCAYLGRPLLMAQGTGITAVGGVASVCKEDANRYCEILTMLGMEEEGDPVAEVQRLQDRAAHAIWSIWEALPGYLIDNCEGTPVSEEMLQHALSKMLADPQYKAPDWAAAPQPAPPAGSVLEDALRERDEADDFIDTLLDEVLGADRAEWSSAYGRAEAMEEVRERITALHKPAVVVMWQRRHQNFENGQWIDCTKEDAEKFGPDGAYGGWEIRELPSNTMPTADEIAVIQRLLDLARQVDHAPDDSEEVACDGFRSHNIDGQDFDDVVEALDALEDLPDDKPGMTLGPAGKAEWALRRLLDPVIRGRAEHNELIARITATKEPQ